MPIKIDRCSFAYRRTQVFTTFSLLFPSGSTVLLGPNGAGKSTLLALAASVLGPRSGAIGYRDLDPSRRRDRAAYRSAVGWMPQQVSAIPGMTVREQVSYHGWLKGLSRRAAWDRADEALKAVNLGDFAARKSGHLSGGQLRRVGLAQTLVHSAEVILMDEPTAGLDPQQRDTFRDIVGRVADTSHIIVSTHQTEDLTGLYNSVVVLDDGQVRFSGPTRDFVRLGGDGSAEVNVSRAYTELVRKEI